jgi:hypothetical protein
LFSLEESKLDIYLMASVPRITNEGTPAPREPFVFTSYGNIGPPHIATFSLPGLTIGLLVWFFSTQVVPNAVSDSVISTSPQEHQPHVDPSPSSPVSSYSLTGEAIKNLRNNENIVILKADKGGATVVMNRIDYNSKMKEHLTNTGSYKKLENNPISKVIKEVKKAIKSSNLDETMKKRLTPSCLITLEYTDSLRSTRKEFQ